MSMFPQDLQNRTLSLTFPSPRGRSGFFFVWFGFLNVFFFAGWGARLSRGAPRDVDDVSLPHDLQKPILSLTFPSPRGRSALVFFFFGLGFLAVSFLPGGWQG